MQAGRWGKPYGRGRVALARREPNFLAPAAIPGFTSTCDFFWGRGTPFLPALVFRCPPTPT